MFSTNLTHSFIICVHSPCHTLLKKVELHQIRQVLGCRLWQLMLFKWILLTFSFFPVKYHGCSDNYITPNWRVNERRSEQRHCPSGRDGKWVNEWRSHEHDVTMAGCEQQHGPCDVTNRDRPSVKPPQKQTVSETTETDRQWDHRDTISETTETDRQWDHRDRPSVRLQRQIVNRSTKTDCRMGSWYWIHQLIHNPPATDIRHSPATHILLTS